MEWKAAPAASPDFPHAPHSHTPPLPSSPLFAVTTIKVGETVGFGPQRDSCGACACCGSGDDNCCTKFQGLYDPKYGGYATSITVPERFAFPIPAGIPLDVAGPLLCAGITTFAPLARHAKKGDRVGVVGIGGLGHMGLQYAAAMGCETWAISTSAAKEAEARKFGAQHFLVSSNAEAMEAARGSFDFILCCASGNFDTGAYLRLLKPRKAFCLVGLPAVEEPVKFLPFDIIVGEKSIVGSMIGGTVPMKEMLDFSAAHKCFPQCEVIPFAEANAGVAKIVANNARYRMVLKIEGFREAQAQ
jgi:alcohol/geraniol dehydrogenase (NADP+)